MGDLSKNLSRKEFKCPCGCGKDTVDAELVVVIQDVRDEFLRPVHINSGHRCIAHNQSVGGSKNSMHLEGRAGDIKLDYIDVNVVYEYLDKKYPDKYGIGLYKTFVHIDTKSGDPRRWSDV